MSMAYSSKDKEFETYGVFPLGEHDFVKVEQTKPADEYPNVVDLGYEVDCDKMYEEFINMRKPNKDHYYLQMSKKFVIDREKVMKNFEDLGFLADNYGGYDMKRAGEYTNKVLDDLPVKLFRKHFTLAKPGWLSKFHSDHASFETHGFRLVLPVNTDAHIKYKDGDYKLAKGKIYFWNIVKEHAGWNPLEHDRLIIMAQMNSDKLVNNGKVLDPISLL